MSLSKSKSTTKPTAFNKPYLEAAGGTLAPAYEAQTAAAKSFEPGFAQARGLLSDTIGGKYLDEGNPYIDQIVHNANSDTTDAVNGQFNSRFGSGYHAKALADAIYANEARLRGGEYDRERGYQNEAVDQYGRTAGQATSLPGIASGQYASNVGGLFGQYNKTTTSTPWGPALINGASNAAAAYFGAKK